MTPITKSERIYLGAVALLAAWVGAFCYFDTNLADVGIPWRVAPLCAGFLGAMYLSGALLMAWNITMTILGYQRAEEPMPGSAPSLQPAE